MQSELKEGDLVFTPYGNPGVCVSDPVTIPFAFTEIKVCWWTQELEDEIWDASREYLQTFDPQELKRRERES